MNIYLKRLGLTENEIKVYLVALELGETSIMPIARIVKMPRTTVYQILERLEAKELIEISQSAYRRIYYPYPPKKILSLLKKKKAEFNKSAESFQENIEEISKMFPMYLFEPQVRYYRGRKELREIYNDLLQEPIDKGWYVGEVSKIIDVLGEEFLDKWIQKRVAKGIRSRSIRIKSEEVDKPIFSIEKELLRTARYAPEGFESPAHILIYGDKVAIITTSKENVGVVIKSRELTKTMQSWFKQLWKVSTLV